MKATIFIVDQDGFKTIDLSEETTLFLEWYVFNHRVKDTVRFQHSNVAKSYMGWEGSAYENIIVRLR